MRSFQGTGSCPRDLSVPVEFRPSILGIAVWWQIVIADITTSGGVRLARLRMLWTASPRRFSTRLTQMLALYDILICQLGYVPDYRHWTANA